MATLIGALILWLLTVGSVKGFALMLAIASILDLIATYFFMAPLVRLLAGRFGDKPALFGVRSLTMGTDISGFSSAAESAEEEPSSSKKSRSKKAAEVEA
jgi:preprotein translocase subunit SecD